MWSTEMLEKLKVYQFILGSSSPRRAEILRSNIGIQNFVVVTSTFEENLSKESKTPEEYVRQTAKLKIPSIISQLDKSGKFVLLVADTIVSCGNNIFEKPQTAENQWRMLSQYRKHPNMRVITGVHVCQISNGQVLHQVYDYEITSLKFDIALADEQLQYYIDTGEGMHVAGGFKFQERGSMLFERIEGDFFNIVGLPVKKSQELLTQIL